MTVSHDPNPYDGPIERADGRRPFNHYLWALDEDWYWANRMLGRRFSSRFEFKVIALADGRWATEGSVYRIEEGESSGRSCVFDTREKAIRISVARFIRLCRHARKWTGITVDRLSNEDAQILINWALEIAHRPPAVLRPLPAPAKLRATKSLPLFDLAAEPPA